MKGKKRRGKQQTNLLDKGMKINVQENITKREKDSHLCCLDHCILADAILSLPLIF